MSPTLSVIIPNFNHGDHLPRVVEELTQQTRPADEILFLDDASTDHSRELLAEVEQKHSNVRVLYNEHNLGVVASQKKLFEAARGDYIYAGAMDDRRLPIFFERAMQMAEKYPTAGLICGKMVSVNEQGERLGLIDIPHWTEPHYAPPEEVCQDYLDRVEPSHSLSGASIYRRDVLKEVGWFQESLTSWGDTFSARAVALSAGICYFPEEVVHWTYSADSFSGRTRSDIPKTLQLIHNAAGLMRQEPFDEIFPEIHVQQWQASYRKQVFKEILRGAYNGTSPESSNFLIRHAQRMMRLPQLLKFKLMKMN